MPVNFDTFRAFLFSNLSRLRGRVTMDTLRPLPVFLGVTGPAFCLSAGAFTPPSRHIDKTAPEKIRARISLNFAFFLTNYALLALGVSLVVALMHPKMILYVGVVWAFWWLHIFVDKNHIPLVAFGRDLGAVITAPRRSLALSIITVIVAVFHCLVPVLSVVSISGLLILLHAVMRDPKHIESSSEFRRGGSADSDEEEDALDEEVIVERGDAI